MMRSPVVLTLCVVCRTKVGCPQGKNKFRKHIPRKKCEFRRENNTHTNVPPSGRKDPNIYIKIVTMSDLFCLAIYKERKRCFMQKAFPRDYGQRDEVSARKSRTQGCTFLAHCADARDGRPREQSSSALCSCGSTTHSNVTLKKWLGAAPRAPSVPGQFHQKARWDLKLELSRSVSFTTCRFVLRRTSVSIVFFTTCSTV